MGFVTTRLVTSPVAVLLVNTTVLPVAVADEKPLNVPAVLAAALVAPAAMLANAVATVDAVAPPTGAV
ncbi:hypothetical protein LTEGF4_12680 [Limnohabitans sp. TEGF004]|nr:hypothetical protein LTEGF4_12680 [Limnohabitans sp. TEGF004]